MPRIYTCSVGPLKYTQRAVFCEMPRFSIRKGGLLMRSSLTRLFPVLVASVAGFVFSVCGSVSTECGSGSDCTIAPTCTDKVQNGTETDIDCGGSCATKCRAMGKCGTSEDCGSGLVCLSGQCAAPSCKDGIKDGDETDVDCGGSCFACAPAAACKVSGDCTSQNCASGVCAAPTCSDGIKNGNESDKDCGGSCSPCATGKTCLADGDCAPLLCGTPVPEGQSAVCGLGNGSDLDLTVPAGMTRTINSVATGGTGTAASTTLTVRDGAGLSADQIVLIHQTQGTGAGQHELNRIASVSGTTVTLKNPLKYDYVTGSQLIVVPQYGTVNVANTATLTAPAWDGQKGGILVFMAKGDVTIAGTVTMAGKGFRGAGVVGVCFPGAPACLLNHGRTGESSTGPAAFSTLSAQSKGSNNGGGGGGGTRGQDCAAGGGGAYGTVGTAGVDGTLGNCLAVAGQHGGGLPGTVVGVPDLTQAIFLGSAGGEGGPDEDGAFPGPGGNGGGTIILWSKSVTVDPATGTLNVSGNPGGVGSTSGPCGGSGGGMGNGGGGSGGAVRIVTTDAVALGTGRVTAAGAAGGAAGSCGATYPGGAGGVGRIQVRAGGTLTGTSTPAAFTN